MGVTAAVYNLIISKGRYFTVTFILTDADGAAIDLSAATITAKVKKTRLIDSTEIIELTSSVGGASNNELTLTYDDTGGTISVDRGYWDLVIAINAGQGETYLYGSVAFPDRPTDL